MLNKRGGIIFGIILISINIISITHSDSSGLSKNDNKIEYDQKIIDYFNDKVLVNQVISEQKNDSYFLEIINNKTWVDVIIKINDVSNITISAKDSQEIQISKDKQRNEIFNNITDSILLTLPKDEFRYKDRTISGRTFFGYITEEGFNKLLNNSEIKAIYMEKYIPLLLSESAPLINATQVWNNLNYTGRGQTICIVDTGIDYTHPDLGNCTQSQFLAGNCSKVPGGYDYVFINDEDPMDTVGHGTHVAGIIASENKTYRGIAPDAKIVAVRVCNDIPIIGCLQGNIEKGLEWCYNNRSAFNISVVSMSIGGGKYGPGNCTANWADDEINDLYNINIPVIISSGNEGYTDGISYPACSQNATSVGSTTKSNTISSFTNRASNLELLAPGGTLLNTHSCPSNDYICSTQLNGGFIGYSGTSMAAPHVAGAAALLLERNPNLTPDNITTILKNTGKNIYDPSTGLNFKRIDILNATNSLCTVTNWSAGSCGIAAGCLPSERKYTRTANPVACDATTKCEYDTSCAGGGGGQGSAEQLTVCSSGCNKTTIQGAVDISDTNDKIFVKDNRTYFEEIVMNATTSAWLDCGGNATISGPASRGISFHNADGPVVVGCKIKNFDKGIYLNSSHALIQNNTFTNNEIAIYLWKNWASDSKIKYNNINTSTLYGIQLYTNTWSDSVIASRIENNILKNNGDKEIYVRFGQDNVIINNNISEGDSYGIHLEGFGTTSNAQIQDNRIFSNLDGLYMQSSNVNALNNNTFCSSNTNTDIIDTGTSDGGSDNVCEKPGSWSDSGTTGCTFFCDSSASVTLLYPLDTAVDTDGNVSLVCQSNDNYNLVNVSLYHNISGNFARNQTINISGTSNITTFTVNNVPNQTIINWNCLAYDNKSRGSFASSNWTLSINILVPPPDDAHKFYIKNSSGNNAAWFGSWGNIVLGGNCTTSSICAAPANSFIIRNSTDNATAYIDSLGNLCVEKGDCSAQSASCNPARNAFIIKNSSNYNVSYIDYDGDLCLIGKLFENSEYL